mgnify:CR=1 FL=1
MACVDRVWQVPLDHPAFAGHFPGRPIVPGVVLLDRAVFLAQARELQRGGNWKVSQSKFLHPCGPGDQLTFDLHPDHRGGYAFAVRRGDSEVATGQLVFEPT